MRIQRHQPVLFLVLEAVKLRRGCVYTKKRPWDTRMITKISLKTARFFQFSNFWMIQIPKPFKNKLTPLVKFPFHMFLKRRLWTSMEDVVVFFQKNSWIPSLFFWIHQSQLDIEGRIFVPLVVSQCSPRNLWGRCSPFLTVAHILDKGVGEKPPTTLKNSYPEN